MKSLKINIIYDFLDEPSGGANQFLKVLKTKFERLGIYESNPSKTDCFIFNSHHCINEILSFKMKYQDKIFIHRIDGPTYLTKVSSPRLDFKIFELNQFVADGTIFQSNWSMKENLKHGFKKTTLTWIIHNAPDNNIFYPLDNNIPKEFQEDKRILVAASWSKNLNKGFKLYKYLDENLDFTEYSMVFIGNSPFLFNNIRHIKPLKPKTLADFFRKCDIYVSGATNEACSNSIIEALNCGLPSVVINSASNPEIVKNGGELFNTYEECIEKISTIKNNYEYYRKNISVQNVDKIIESYINFIRTIHYQKVSGKYEPKKLKLFYYYKILFKNNLIVSKLKIVLIREFFKVITKIKKFLGT